jgi:hypothetical protein
MANKGARGRGAKVTQSARLEGRKKYQTQDSVPVQSRRTSPPQELQGGEPRDSLSLSSQPDDGALEGLLSSDDEYLDRANPSAATTHKRRNSDNPVI